MSSENWQKILNENRVRVCVCGRDIEPQVDSLYLAAKKWTESFL